MRHPFRNHPLHRGASGGHASGARSIPAKPTTATAPSAVRTRLANLATAIDGTRTRPKLDMRKLLLGFGIALIGAGVADTVLGWYGAAHSPYLFQEVPYLISGGLLGVCLVISGGALFVAGWIVRVLEENRRHTVVLTRNIDRLERALQASAQAHAGNGNGNGNEMPTALADVDPRTEYVP